MLAPPCHSPAVPGWWAKLEAAGGRGYRAALGGPPAEPRQGEGERCSGKQASVASRTLPLQCSGMGCGGIESEGYPQPTPRLLGGGCLTARKGSTISLLAPVNDPTTPSLPFSLSCLSSLLEPGWGEPLNLGQAVPQKGMGGRGRDGRASEGKADLWPGLQPVSCPPRPAAASRAEGLLAAMGEVPPLRDRLFPF